MANNYRFRLSVDKQDWFNNLDPRQDENGKSCFAKPDNSLSSDNWTLIFDKGIVYPEFEHFLQFLF